MYRKNTAATELRRSSPFGAMLSKAAVRDVGRVLQMPYGQVDRLSKLIPVEGVKPDVGEEARGRRSLGCRKRSGRSEPIVKVSCWIRRKRLKVCYATLPPMPLAW